jgi:hypothetical protein
VRKAHGGDRGEGGAPVGVVQLGNYFCCTAWSDAIKKMCYLPIFFLLQC